MRLFEILKEDSSSQFSVNLTSKWVEEGDPDDYVDDQTFWEFDMFYKGKKIGDLRLDDYFGQMLGNFGARTVDINRHSEYTTSREDNPEEHVTAALNNYFRSKKGREHFEVMSRQQGLGTQLDEIKVTKTLAGKKQTPSRQLAMDKKKRSKNQGKKPVELNKSAKSMKDLSNEILKGEYTNTREFGLD